MCTTCYDNFLHRCHNNNKLADLSGILIWAPLDICYIYKVLVGNKQLFVDRTHLLEHCLAANAGQVLSGAKYISDRRKKIYV